MNLHYTKGTKWTDFQPWIVSKWMIIWLISEINNNNCLSLLIRALNSKWNSSAEFQWAGFTAPDSVLCGEKRDMILSRRQPQASPYNQKSNKNGGGSTICKGDGWGLRGTISGFLPCLKIILCSKHPRNESQELWTQTTGARTSRKDSYLCKDYLSSSVYVLQVWSNPSARSFTQAAY